MTRKYHHKQNTEWVEGRLRDTLQPVQPRAEFVGSLRKNLDVRMDEYRRNPPLSRGQVILMVGVSLLSIVMLLVLSVRAMRVLLSGINGWRQGKRLA